MLMFPLGRRKIGRYELLHPLASGGMATVFAGRFFGMGGFEKLVSVKVIHPHLAGKQDFVEMFLDEARLSARLHHPNAIEIFEVGEDDGLLFIVAELVHGRNLEQVLKAAKVNGTPLPTRSYLSVMARVCDALHAAHTMTSSDGSPMHLVHRDISPSNILISYSGHIKLIDFGIAFAKDRISTTRTNVVKGKRGYLAPEQFSKETLDCRTDIFSMGVVLYCLATGKHPFPGENESQHVAALLSGKPVSPRVLQPDMPIGLERTILKALAQDPANRHQSAEELGQELRSILLSLGGLADNVDIAGWMELAFSTQITEEKKQFKRAAQALQEAERTPLPDSLSNLELYQGDRLENPTGGETTLLKSRRRAAAPSGTELLNHLSARAQSQQRPRWLFSILGFATVGLVFFLYSAVWQTAQSPTVISPTTDHSLDEPKETPASSTESTMVADTSVEEPALFIELPVDTARDTTQAAEELPLYPLKKPRQTSTRQKTAVKKIKRGTLAECPYDTQ
jgi:serine/threonine-protein kinase